MIEQPIVRVQSTQYLQIMDVYGSERRRDQVARGHTG